MLSGGSKRLVNGSDCDILQDMRREFLGRYDPKAHKSLKEFLICHLEIKVVDAIPWEESRSLAFSPGDISMIQLHNESL